jgi:hypothetical protein
MLSTAQLTCKYRVECINLFLGPFHTCTHHERRETRLICGDCVPDDGEVHKGDFPDVLVKIAFEDTLSEKC